MITKPNYNSYIQILSIHTQKELTVYENKTLSALPDTPAVTTRLNLMLRVNTRNSVAMATRHKHRDAFYITEGIQADGYGHVCYI